jgi:urea transporter
MSTYPTNPERTAGPSGDGSRSLASESKAGLAMAFVVNAALAGLLVALGNLDTSTWTGVWAIVGVPAIGTVTGLVTAYLKRNR